jgi:hypothetical protein
MTQVDDTPMHGQLAPSCLSALRSATTELQASKITARWPKGYSFVVRFDQRDELVGWIIRTSADTVVLARGVGDASRIALLAVEQQREELSSVDHVSVRLTRPPETMSESVPAAHKIDLLPVITKVTDRAIVPVGDEDSLLVAGVLSALARFGEVTGMVVSTIVAQGRTLRTYIVAVPPPAAPTLPDEVRIRYESGNEHAPIGRGLIRIDIHHDESVRLLNDRLGVQRVWLAWLEPSFDHAFAAATSRARFPARPSVRVAPAGSNSFAISARAEDGTVLAASGFPSPEYKWVSLLFMQLVAQMSADAVLGFPVECTEMFVRDALEIGDERQ